MTSILFSYLLAAFVVAYAFRRWEGYVIRAALFAAARFAVVAGFVAPVFAFVFFGALS